MPTRLFFFSKILTNQIIYSILSAEHKKSHGVFWASHGEKEEVKKQMERNPEVMWVLLILVGVIGVLFAGTLNNALPPQLRLSTPTPDKGIQTNIAKEPAAIMVAPAIIDIGIAQGCWREVDAKVDRRLWGRGCNPNGSQYFNTTYTKSDGSVVEETLTLEEILAINLDWENWPQRCPGVQTSTSVTLAAIPVPTAALKLTATSEPTIASRIETIVTPIYAVTPEVISASNEGLSLPSSVSGAGFFFLVFLGFLGLRNFFKLLGQGKGAGTKILVRQLEKKRK